MMLRFVSGFAVLFSMSAFAQTILYPQASPPTTETYTFGAAGCTTSVSVVWNSNSALIQACLTTPPLELKLWSTESTCGDKPQAGDTLYETVAATSFSTPPKTSSFEVKIGELPGFLSTNADGGSPVTCDDTRGQTKTHWVCGSVAYLPPNGLGVGCGTETFAHARGLKLVYDTKPPELPTFDLEAQDAAIVVRFKVGTDAQKVQVEMRTLSTDGGETGYDAAGETEATNSSLRIEKLANGTTYEVRMRAVDEVGNVSDPSEAQQVTPVLTQGYWGRYRAADGDEQGGCSTTAFSLPWLFAALVLRRQRRHSRSISL